MNEHQRHISDSIHELEAHRRKKMKEVMDEYDRKVYRPAKQEIQDKCGEAGHTFIFSHLGPLGHSWYYCAHCKKSKVET